MRLYNFGYPAKSRVAELEYIFEHLSTYVCEDCGDVATHTTEGWITQLCKKCFQASYISTVDLDKYKKKRKDYTVRLQRFDKELGFQNIRYDCRPYWEEYRRCIKMTDTEFINYILVD